ncbi:Arginine--tRNA ligase [Rickettsiales bacterium Ac37b]|nr:Arginine--tRNA ligase [Rickettsiales bacterium Ac37b]
MDYLKYQIEQDFIDTINKLFNLSLSTLSIRSNLALQEFDYQVDACFIIAKELKKNPLEIAEIISTNLSRNDIYYTVKPSKPGFINIKIDSNFLQSYLSTFLNDPRLCIVSTPHVKTIVVDYGSPNVAKEMHVGHLRSAIIGDAIARILTFLGHNVIRQNHTGDWGTQFGFLIQYIIEDNLKFNNISELNQAYKAARELFDNDKNFELRARKRLTLLQSHDKETYSIWENLSKISYQHFNSIFKKLGVLLTEQDVRGESFYNFMLPDIVKELLNTCIAEESQSAKVIFVPGFYDKDKNPLPMIIQKSDGGYLYHTTDLAAAKYRLNTLHADRIIYVTDMRQKQHFAMLFSALKYANWLNPSTTELNHIAFGTVLGEDHKPFKTRSGETISLNLLLEEAENKATDSLKRKYPELSEYELKNLANSIGIGALKYADLSNDLNKDYVFSWEKMLAFNGNTALYLQNAYVRIHSIFRKENFNIINAKGNIIITNDIERMLCLKISEFPDIIRSIEIKLTPHLLCNYLYELASLFHNFYESCHIGKCKEEDIKLSRLLISLLVAKTLKLGLELLGIQVVEKM